MTAIKPKILFIANNNLGLGMSGGDSIFINFIRYWQPYFETTLLGSQDAVSLLAQDHITPNHVIITDHLNPDTSLTVFSLIKHFVNRLFKGLISLWKNRRSLSSYRYVYTCSDFYPDLLLGFVIKIFCPKTLWLAGYYLIVPSPFDHSSPHFVTHQYIKGLFYYLSQRLSLTLVNHFADFVFITSTPDTKYFPHLPSDHIIVVQGGVDLAPSQKYLQSDHKIPVYKRRYDALFLGRLHPQKGALELIDIWRLVVNQLPHAQLAIIGDGQLLPQLQQKITDHELSANIHLLGFLYGEAKYDVFKDSRLVVHPSIFDSGGMSAAEAMAWGLPGVSFDLEALRTYYPQGMIKTSCFDKSQFADNIVKLLTTPPLYCRTSQEALALIQNQWSWSARCQTIYQQFTRL